MDEVGEVVGALAQSSDQQIEVIADISKRAADAAAASTRASGDFLGFERSAARAGEVSNEALGAVKGLASQSADLDRALGRFLETIRAA